MRKAISVRKKPKWFGLEFEGKRDEA